MEASNVTSESFMPNEEDETTENVSYPSQNNELADQQNNSEEIESSDFSISTDTAIHNFGDLQQTSDTSGSSTSGISFNCIEEELESGIPTSDSATSSYVDHFSAYHEYNNIYVSSKQQLDYGAGNLHYTYDSQHSQSPALLDYSYVQNPYSGNISQNCDNSYHSNFNEWPYSGYSHDAVPENASAIQTHPVEDVNCAKNGYYVEFQLPDNVSHGAVHDNMCATDNSNWLQSTVNEIFADTRVPPADEIAPNDEQPQPDAEQQMEPVYTQENAYPTGNAVLSPPTTPITAPLPNLKPLETNTSPSNGAYLMYVPMRVTRNAENGSIQMQYDCPPSSFFSQLPPYPQVGGSNKPGSAEYGMNKKNPPKTVREMLDEYRQRSYLQEFPALRYLPNSGMEGYLPTFFPSENPEPVPQPYQLPTSHPSPMEYYDQLSAMSAAPVNSSYVSSTSDYQDVKIQYEEPFDASQNSSHSSDSAYFSSCSVSNCTPIEDALHDNHENPVEQTYTDIGVVSTSQSKPELIEAPLTPADTDSSIQSPAPSEDATNFCRSILPGIQHIRKLPITSCAPELLENVDVNPPEKSYETPDWSMMPEFIEGHVDSKEHRPKHFELLSLQIGSFEVNPTENTKRSSNKFKALFCKRRFTYEFNWPYDTENPEAIEFACIHVPFKSIVALNCTKAEVYIHVNFKPRMFGGMKQATHGAGLSTHTFNTRREVDITNGQLAISAVHKVSLKNGHIDKLKNSLIYFDKRFWYLLQREIPSEAYDPVLLPEFIDASQASDSPSCKRAVDKKSSTNEKKKACKGTSHSCSCKISCKSMRCSCSKLNLKCGNMCQCEQCDNPLNVMSDAGKDLTEILQDKCLMHNIFKPLRLESCLDSIIQLKCCENMVKVSDMVPGQVACPHGCDVLYQYSWCYLKLHDDGVNQRNHCSNCMKCIRVEQDHTELCRKSRHLMGEPKGVVTRRRSQALLNHS